MVTRDDVFNYAKNTYGTNPDNPWGDQFPNYRTLRHNSNGKWYGLIMDVALNKLGREGEDIVDVLNVKSTPDTVSGIRDGRSILTAYHMDKENWLTLVLEEFDSMEQIENFLDESYELTK